MCAISPILIVMIHCVLRGQKCTLHVVSPHHNNSSQCLLNTHCVIVLGALHVPTHLMARTLHAEVTPFTDQLSTQLFYICGKQLWWKEY